MGVVDIKTDGFKMWIETEKMFQVDGEYSVSFTDSASGNTGEKNIRLGNLQELIFNDMYSDKPMGYNLENGQSTFRLFAPRANVVKLHIFDNYDDEVASQVIDMVNDGDQVFEAFLPGTMWGKYYGYQITDRQNAWKPIKPDVPADTIFADPYSKALATKNVFPQKGRTLILDTSYDWEGVQQVKIDISDAVILEAHVRDLTASSTAGSDYPGTFKGLLDADRGGLNYIKELGVNVVEFLPIHDFNNIEAPFGVRSHGIRNGWNAYSENYWGYMTTNWFSPESYYASDGTLDPSKWAGTDGRVVRELKDTIKEFHRNGIGVVMDVVYNHVSGYDEAPLKIIDYEYFFRPQDKTGTGNEVESRRKMVRRMIIDSLKYWMTEYRIDGFRFDLAASHDKETIAAIYKELKAINPNVYLIAEPWGGAGLSQAGDFLDLGWSKWEAGIRDAVRATNRPTREGAVWALGNTGNALQIGTYWGGTTAGEPWQHVAYIESHDDTTLGDNLRVQSGFYKFAINGKEPNRITDIEAYLTLTPQLLDANRVAASALFLSQGPVMIHLGQEWARGKVIPDLSDEMEELYKGSFGSSSDYVVFQIPTPNSYSADNYTNWINYDYVEYNRDLLEYYKGWIELRKSQPLLGKGDPTQIKLLESGNSNSLGVNIHGEIFGFVNSDPNQGATFEIPPGNYTIVVDKENAGTASLGSHSGGTVEVGTASTLVLLKN
jgi:pullulanase/glycogen debranching enzyme